MTAQATKSCWKLHAARLPGFLMTLSCNKATCFVARHLESWAGWGCRWIMDGLAAEWHAAFHGRLTGLLDNLADCHTVLRAWFNAPVAFCGFRSSHVKREIVRFLAPAWPLLSEWIASVHPAFGQAFLTLRSPLPPRTWLSSLHLTVSVHTYFTLYRSLLFRSP